MDNRKEAICNALAAFIRQRPGLEFRNYCSSWTDTEGRRAYFTEARRIARDKRDAESLLLAVRHNDGISADAIIAASQRAYSGRLTLEPHEDGVTVDYCTGQYWPTEYRRAAAAVCAAALWDWQRENMPEPSQKLNFHGYDGTNAGDWLRRKFRQDFGSAMQKRWFD